MHQKLAASKLVGVASSLAAVAPLLWSSYEMERVDVLRPVPASPISGCDQPRQSSATE